MKGKKRWYAQNIGKKPTAILAIEFDMALNFGYVCYFAINLAF